MKLILILSLFYRTLCSLTSDLDSLLDVIPNKFQLGWKFVGTDSIEFAIVWNQISWIGIGFGKYMDGTDMNVGQLEGGILKIYDQTGVGHDVSDDKSQDIKLVGQEIDKTNNKLTFRYNRKLNTGDSLDKILVKGGSYTFCYAFTDSDCSHDLSQCGAFSVNLTSGQFGQAALVSIGPSDFLIAHGVLYFLAWGLFADLGIYFARFKKTNNSYVTYHLLCFLFVDFTTIVMYFLSKKQFEDGAEDPLRSAHSIIALIMLILTFIQHIGGVVIKHLIQDRKKNDRSLALTMILGHRVQGIVLTCLGKANILIGLWYYGAIKLFYICLAFTIILLVFGAFFETIKISQTRIKAYVAPTPLPSTDIRQKLMKMVNQGESREDILNALPDIKWVIYNSAVYDVTEFEHPGGNFIIENCVGREIGRFFVGAYNLETTDLKPYAHSQAAYELIQRLYIGEIESQQVLTIEPKVDEKKETLSNWTKYSQRQLSKTVIQFEFKPPEGQIKQFMVGLEWIGRHFTLSKAEYGEKVRLYTTVISLSEANRERRNRIIQLYDSHFGAQGTQEPIGINEGYLEQCDTLPFVIKKYAYPETLSAFLHDTLHSQYVIKGPFGLGLELKPQSQGLHIAFVGGTGILPFVDLLDYLLQKAVYTVLSQSNNPRAKEIELNNNNFKDSLNNFSFKIYAAFANQEEFLEADWIKRLYQISKTHNLGLFDMRVRFSDKATDEVIPTVTERFDQEFIMKAVQKDSTQKVYVCGPPAMNNIVPKSLQEMGFDEKKLIIV